MSPTPLLARLLQRHGLQSATFGSLFDIVGQSRSTFISQHGREFGEQAANLYDDALRQAVPLARRYREQRLSGPAALSAIKTEADLYEYLLIDTRVATDVTTSRVAQAIASVQQYINATLLNMEPGRKPLPADDVADWAQSGSQYAIWAGDQELQDYPENYIDPTLRENRTGLFSLLETQLSAHALTDTSIQDGFLAYLAGFETISNLKVLNGYAESPDTSNAVYYLVGQSNIMPNKFYWRSLDMSKRDSSGALNPTAWSEWNDIELAQSADIEVIRPFVSGGRLHLVWLQVGELPQTGPDTPEADADSEYRLCCAYLGFDGKPYLLTSMNNNMGAGTTWGYRGSAQEWLDEKQAAPERACALPFAMPLLSHIVSADEISGNTLTRQYHYRQGVYDGVCREFRGFGFVQHLDTDDCAVATGGDDAYSPPTLTRAWYHTGLQDTQDDPAETPYADPALFTLGAPRFTSLNADTGADDVLPSPDAGTLFQLSRALKGSLLRQEIYGQDGSAQATVPYQVQTARYQVRLLQPASDTQPYAVVLPMMLEQLDVRYERIASDPQVQQKVTLQVDACGVVTAAVAIDYARRPQGDVNPYPSTLPTTLWDSSYDDAQQSLRLTESLTGVYHLTDPQAWRLGLPWQQRQNVVTDPDGYAGYPVGNSSTGLDYEALVQPDGVLGDSQTRVYAGQSLVCYFNQAGTAQQDAQSAPPWLALVHHVEVAELDAEALQAYDDVPDFDPDTELPAAGYAERPLLFPRADESAATVWVIAHDYHGYVDAEGAWLPFNLPRTQQSSLLVGASSLVYDDDNCVVVSSTDALGNQVQTACDYRFLAPWQLIDANGNKQEVLFDALGRVCTTSFYGSELDENDTVIATGFDPVADYDAGAAAVASIDAALADPAGAVQGCASACLYQPDSWMGSVSQAGLAIYGSPAQAADWWQALLRAHLITPDGRIRPRGHAWARGETEMAGLPSSLRPLLADAPRSPAQSAVLQADQYPGADTAAQIRIALTRSDGFGRALQSKQKAEPGNAYQVDADGNVVLDANGAPVVADTGTAPRWTVSGRVEYDNKGQPIRQYQPYFINSPQYVNDASIRNWGYADTHYYDALGREIRVVTALGYLRRHSDYPWFSVDEDENDTLSEVLSAQGSR